MENCVILPLRPDLHRNTTLTARSIGTLFDLVFKLNDNNVMISICTFI